MRFVALARWAPYVILFGAAVAVGAELARPLHSASISFDSSATVLYFERIVTGQRLEAFVTTTPKPLLTVLFGLAHAITHDWRSLAWLTILAHGLGVTMTAYLAGRLAGPVAAAFVGVALLNDATLLIDVGFASATPYALVGWALAGWALTAERPRYLLAGVALALATLARVETLVLVGVALLAVGWSAWAPAAPRGPAPPRQAWLVPVVGVLALPVMLLHDQLLAGDPLYWTKPASVYGANLAGSLPSALDVAKSMVGHYWAMGGVVLLSVLGAAALFWERRYALLAGLLALGPGVAIFLVALAARHLIVPARYFSAVDVAVVFAAGIGLAGIGLRSPSSRVLGGTVDRLGQLATSVVPVGVAALAAIVLSGFYWQQDPGLRASIAGSRRLALDTERVEPVLAAAAERGPLANGMPRILVPVPVQPRVAVDLGRSLLEVGPSTASRIDLAAGRPSPGQVVFHDRASDGADPRWADFEITVPRMVGAVSLLPVQVEPARGIWVVEVR